jgi:hypothetical protein
MTSCEVRRHATRPDDPHHPHRALLSALLPDSSADPDRGQVYPDFSVNHTLERQKKSLI